MALSTCPKCNNRIFATQEYSPIGSAYKLIFIQCASCGTVVGVLDYYNIGTLIQKQNEAIRQIASHLRIGVDL